jgi:hypothetical protein
MKLADLQRQFSDWLVAPASDAAPTLDVRSKAGFAVYQNNYRAQLVGCLQVSFAHLRAWLGEQAFLQAAVAHIDSRPPHAWTLDAYGADFGETLQQVFPDNPDVHELAWIEWALSESFVAADATPLSNGALQELDWDAARLCLTPSLRYRAASTNADAIWSALAQDEPVPEAAMLEEPGGLLVWRRDFTSQLKRLDPIEHAALLSLRADDRFAAFCAALVERLGEEAGVTKAGTLLADWLGAGIVVGVTSVN